MRFDKGVTLLAVVLCSVPDPSPAQTEIARDFSPVTDAFDHERREVMIPMRDGAKLHTVIVIPRNATKPAPIIITRTPYGAGKSTMQASSPHAAMVLPPADEPLVGAGYIRVYQDIRGRYGSEGGYVMNLPVRGPLNPGKVDQATDAWDTIDWLVKNVPGNNGRVGLTGVSYAGWTTLMGLIDPHPALKAAVPMFPMVDGWIGDDFYHNGALRQTMFEWIYNMGTAKAGEHHPPFGYRDLYEAYMAAGSADDFARRYKGDALATWRKIVDHPTYDGFWHGQAMQDLLAKADLRLPVLIVHGLFDQEDSFGGIAAYEALEAKDRNNDKVFLALGPWSHGQSQREGARLGALAWNSDTSQWFREKVLLAFWNQHLKGVEPPRPIAPVLSFDTGTKEWRESRSWPSGGRAVTKRLYLHPAGRLSFEPPTDVGGYAEYASDPAKPVPYRVRPVLPMFDADSGWSQWLADDQRPFSDRPDVLTFVSEPLTERLTVSGPVVANLFASTTGTDADWVVKLIDVYPPEVRSNPALGGHQLMVSGDIMRGRYREDLARPVAAVPGKAASYRVRLPQANHSFQPGHRIMVQVQSSWFPLYDRNPQTFVENVAKAKPGDYRAASHRVYFGRGQASALELSIEQ